MAIRSRGIAEPIAPCFALFNVLTARVYVRFVRAQAADGRVYV